MSSMLRTLLVPALLLAVIGTLPRPTTSDSRDEGMWTYDNLPLALLKERYDFEPTEAWLDHLRLSSLRVSSGGSASFVSSNGLILTNHHVALEALNELSTPDRDYVKTGFAAASLDDEAVCHGVFVDQLVSMEDVTSRIDAAAEGAEGARAAERARTEAVSALESEEQAAHPGFKIEVVKLYAGGQYMVYRYKTYDDVRLVFAPEMRVAYFGGDFDNFTYPRYCLDFTFFRAYENGAPAEVENHLTWSTSGTKDGDLVFVSGHPGNTSRLYTMSELVFEREGYLPAVLALLEGRERVFSAYAEEGEEQRIEILDTLEDPVIWARKQAEEDAFRAALIEANDVEALGLFEIIRTGRERAAEIFPDVVFVRGRGSMAGLARTIVNLASMPESARPPQFRGEALDMMLEQFTQALPTSEGGEIAQVEAGLTNALTVLGAEHPFVLAALGDRTPGAVARAVIEGTRMGDQAFWKELLEAGPDAIQTSEDPLVAWTLSVEPHVAAADLLRREYQSLAASESDASARLARSRFDVFGKSYYPDATFTLRLSFGTVKGYELGTTRVPSHTNFYGLYARNAAFEDQEPFNLPERWLEATKKLDLSVPMDFVSTNDIIGGNSGSPVTDREGHVVGLIFDGNIQSLLANYTYDEDVSRSVSVDVRGIAQALDRVYDADALLKELGLR